jgi:hypothetical protein
MFVSFRAVLGVFEGGRRREAFILGKIGVTNFCPIGDFSLDICAAWMYVFHVNNWVVLAESFSAGKGEQRRMANVSSGEQVKIGGKGI